MVDLNELSIVHKENESTRKLERDACFYVIVFCGAFSVGSAIGWSSSGITDYQLKDPSDFPPQSMERIISIFALAATLSTIVIYKFYQTLGTRPVIIAGAGLMITSWQLLAFGKTSHIVFSGRVLAGISAGIIHFLVPVYVRDCTTTPEQKYPIVDCVFHAAYVFGILLQNISGLLSTPIEIKCMLSSLMPALLFVGVLFSSGARPAVSAPVCDETPQLTRQQQNIIKILDDERATTIKPFLKFVLPKERRLVCAGHNTVNLRQLFTALGLVCFDQFVGITPMIFYLVRIFQLTDSQFSAQWSAVCSCALFVLGIILTHFKPNSVSDRTLAHRSAISMAIILYGLGAFCHIQGTWGHYLCMQFVPFLGIGLLLFSYGVGLFQFTWKQLENIAGTSHYEFTRMLAVSIHYAIIYVLTAILPYLLYTIGIGWMLCHMGTASILLYLYLFKFLPRDKIVMIISTHNAIDC